MSLRHMSVETFQAELKLQYPDIAQQLAERKDLMRVLTVLKESVDELKNVPDICQYFLIDDVRLTDGEAISVSLKESSQKIYWAFLRYLYQYDKLNKEIFRGIMRKIQEETGILGKELWNPVRVAMTGKLNSPDLAALAEIMGKKKVGMVIRKLVD